jgi:hypothetical protein
MDIDNYYDPSRPNPLNIHSNPSSKLPYPHLASLTLNHTNHIHPFDGGNIPATHQSAAATCVLIDDPIQQQHSTLCLDAKNVKSLHFLSPINSKQRQRHGHGRIVNDLENGISGASISPLLAAAADDLQNINYAKRIQQAAGSVSMKQEIQMFDSTNSSDEKINNNDMDVNMHLHLPTQHVGGGFSNKVAATLPSSDPRISKYGHDKDTAPTNNQLQQQQQLINLKTQMQHSTSSSSSLTYPHASNSHTMTKSMSTPMYMTNVTPRSPKDLFSPLAKCPPILPPINIVPV